MSPIKDVSLNRGVALKPLASGHLAVLSKSDAVYLTVWDTKFGTLQLEQLHSDDLKLNVFEMAFGNVEAYGDVLVIGCGQKSLSTYSFYPIYMKPSTLLDALNKGRVKTSTSVVQLPFHTKTPNEKQFQTWSGRHSALESIDKRYIEQLNDAQQVPDESAYLNCFVKWFTEKHAKMREFAVPDVGKVPKMVVGKEWKSLLHLPRLEISQTQVLQLAPRLFSDPTQFWPRPVIEYLASVGYLSSAQRLGGLLQPILERGDFLLAKNCLEWIPDLTTQDWIAFLTKVCSQDLMDIKAMEQAIDEPMMKRNERFLKRHQERLHAQDGLEKIKPHPSHFKLGRAHHYFFSTIFTRLSVCVDAKVGLKQLSDEQLSLLLDWLLDVILPSEDEASDYHPLIWLWNQERYSEWVTVN